MSRSTTTGLYTRVSNSFSQPVTGTIIDPTDADTFFDDVEESMNSFICTSTTSLAIGAGTKAFTTQTTKAFLVGMFVQAFSQADHANYMYGTVASYAGGVLTLDVTVTSGAGTLADWLLISSGARGAIGPTGPTGATGPSGGGLANVVEDTTPQLGGDLDLNGHVVTGLVPGTNIQAYSASLATLSALGNYKVVYSNGSSAVVALSLGADATIFASNGAAAAPTFRTLDNLGGVVKAGNQTLAGGFSATSYSGGSVTGAGQTYTPAAANGNFQHITLNGSSLTGTFTFAIPSTVCSVIVEVTNGGSGAVGATLSTSGYTKVTGDTWASTNGNRYAFCITRMLNYVHLHIQALQ